MMYCDVSSTLKRFEGKQRSHKQIWAFWKKTFSYQMLSNNCTDLLLSFVFVLEFWWYRIGFKWCWLLLLLMWWPMFSYQHHPISRLVYFLSNISPGKCSFCVQCIGYVYQDLKIIANFKGTEKKKRVLVNEHISVANFRLLHISKMEQIYGSCLSLLLFYYERSSWLNVWSVYLLTPNIVTSIA